MSKNTTVSLTLQIKGNAGTELKRISDYQVQSTTKLNQQWTQVNSAQAKFVNTAKAGTEATINTSRAGDQLLRTNRMLEGVLRQQSIQTKLQSQLFKQQEGSAKQMANWMKQVEQSSQRTQKASKETASLWQKGGAVIGGVTGGYMAAKAVAATPLERGRNFSKVIFDATASITNGFNGMSKQEAKAQNEQLMGYAKDAVRQGHGTVEGTAQAAGILAASGIYEKVSDLKAPLQAIAKSSFASGADETDMAKLAQQVKQFGVGVDRTQVAFDRMIGSGQAGGFELKDMSQFLPVLLASASRAGYTGERGLNDVTTHLQLARKYTGTPGEAATNIDDLYGLVNQKHFKDAIAKNIHVEKGDPTKLGKKNKRVFDLTTYLANNQIKGIDTITSVAMLMDRQLSKNPQYQKLNARLATAIKSKNQEEISRTKQAIELVTSGEFGDIFHNKQSLAGISAIITGVKNGDYKDIYDKSWNKEGATASLADIKGDNEFAQSEAVEQEKILAQIKIYETVNSALGNFEKGLVSTMRSNEALTASAIAATGALSVLAAAGGGAVLGGALGGKGSLGGAVMRGGSAIATGTGAVIGSAAGQVAIAGALGYGVGTVSRNMYMTTETGQKFDNWGGEKITQALAFFGNQEAKDALEGQAKYEQMIAEQQKQTNSINQGFSMLAQTIVNNKPILPNFPAPQPLSSLAQSISSHATQQEQRYGAIAPLALK